MTARNWLTRIARTSFAILASVAALAGVAEIGLRCAGLGNPVIYKTDDACGYLPVPQQHTSRFLAQNAINDFSMRSDPVSREKPADTFRVLFVGDSVTYGTTYVDQKKIFTSLLQKSLPARMGRKVEVLNASAGGWGVGNELGYLRSRGTFNADLVVFVLNSSDSLQPAAHLEPNDLNYPQFRPALALSEAWTRYARPRLGLNAAAVDPGSLPSAQAEDLSMSPKVLAHLEDAKRFAHQSHAGFAVVFVPFRPEGGLKPDYEQGVKNLFAWCRASSTPLVDATPAIEALPRATTHYDEAHLRPHGHEVVAAVIAQAWERTVAAAAPHSHQFAAASLVREAQP